MAGGVNVVSIQELSDGSTRVTGLPGGSVLFDPGTSQADIDAAVDQMLNEAPKRATGEKPREALIGTGDGEFTGEQGARYSEKPRQPLPGLTNLGLTEEDTNRYAGPQSVEDLSASIYRTFQPYGGDPRNRPSAGGAFVRGAGRAVGPTAGGLAGAGAGAALGLVGGPLAFATVPLGAVIGGIGGALAGGYGQEKVLEQFPEFKARIEQQRLADEAAQPLAAFAGDMAPSLATGRPNLRSLRQLVGSAALGGGFEAGAQAYEGKPLDLGRVAISAGGGALTSKQNRFGDALFGKESDTLSRTLSEFSQPTATSEDLVSGALRIGERPTPAMVMPEGALARIVNDVSRINPDAAARLQTEGQRVVDRAPSVGERLAYDVMPGDTDLTPAFVKDEADRIQQELQERYGLTQAERAVADTRRTTAVETAPQGVVPEVTRGDAGQRTSVSLQAKRDADEATYQAAYDELDALGDEALSPEQAQGYALRLNEAAKALRRKTERTNIPGAESALAQLNVEEPSVLNLLGVRQLIAENQSGATGADAKALADMKREIDTILGEMRDSPISDAARKAIDARSAYGSKWEGVFEDGKFRPSFLGGLLEKSDEEGFGGLLLGRNTNLPAQTGKAVSNFKALRDELGADSPEWASIRTEVLERALSKDMGKPSFGSAFDTWVRNNPELANALVPPGAEEVVKAARGDIRKAETMLQEAARKEAEAKSDLTTGMERFTRRVASTELGKSFFDSTPEDFSRRLTGATPEDRNMAKVGVRGAVRDMLKDVAGSIGAINSLADNRYAQANLRSLLGDDEADEIIVTAKAASAVMARGLDLGGTAKAASRSGSVADEDGVNVAPQGVAVQGGPTGQKMTFFSTALNSVSRALTAKGLNRDEALEIADALLDPARFQAVAAQIEQQVGKKAADLAMRRARAFYANAGRQLGVQATIQTVQALPPSAESTAPAAEQTPAEQPATAEFTSLKTPNDVIPKERAVEVAIPIIAGPNVEGTGDNPNSTAAGYGQFTNPTFVAYYRKVRPEESKGMSEAQILAQRGTGVEKDMLKAYTQDSVNRLESERLPITVRNIYALHHMGHGGGVGLLQARPDAPAEVVLGTDVVSANPQFSGKTVSGVLTWLEQHAAKGITPDAKGYQQGGAVRSEPAVAGNIDLHNRPVVKNADGSISTVRSITVGFDDKTYVLPTVVKGRVVSDQEAIAHFRKTGEHLGAFNSLRDAESYSQRLHQEQAAEYATPK